MKLYQICILVFVCYTAADQDESESIFCDEEMTGRIDIDCLSKVYNRSEFISDYNATMSKYNDNPDDNTFADEFLNKYCTNLLEFVTCFLNIKESEPKLTCNESLIYSFMQPRMRGIQTMATYSCQNNAELVKKLFPHEGFNTVFINGDLYGCFFFLIESKDTLCDQIDVVRSCMLKVVENHENKDIAKIINDVIERGKTSIAC